MSDRERERRANDEPLVSDIPGPWRALRRATIAGGPAVAPAALARMRRLIPIAEVPAVTPRIAPAPPAFTPEEADTVRTLADHIVPSDATPGAADTAAPEMVLAIVGDRPGDLVKELKDGLAGVNTVARQMAGDALPRLDRAAAAAVVEHVANAPEFRKFWDFIRSQVVLAFYSLPEGYEPIGLPGPNIDEGGFPFPPRGS